MAIKLRSPGREIVLPLGRENAGVSSRYRNALRRLIKRMHRDTLDTVSAYYKRADPELAQDANPITALSNVLARLRKKWTGIFSQQAEALAEQFVNSCQRDSEVDLQRRLKRAGFGIVFKPDADTKRRMNLVVQYNVSLIKSISENYHDSVEFLVVKSAQNGGDLARLSKQLRHRYGVSKNRADFIARDQNTKLNRAVERLRQQQVGITEQAWQHAGGGRHPRPDHVAATGTRFKISEGCKISGEYIQPGELPNCGCKGRGIIPGYHK